MEAGNQGTEELGNQGIEESGNRAIFTITITRITIGFNLVDNGGIISIVNRHLLKIKIQDSICFSQLRTMTYNIHKHTSTERETNL